MSNGIYIHIPFCLKKCAYCDFNSYQDKMHLKEEYIQALISEMEPFYGLSADTVYIGGGTPTVLSEKEISKLISAIRKNFRLSDNYEFTIESNPATESMEKYKLLKELGVNRLSIGVQSFSDEELKALSRVHNSHEAQKAVEDAFLAGFENVSIDLMEAIPLQTKESLAKSVEKAISLGVKHISSYSLIVEEGTLFYESTPVLPNEDEERQMHHLAKSILKENGFLHYEISNYAKAGYESRHNLKYWTREPYYGFGAGAHSFYNEERISNIAGVEEYIKSPRKIKERIKISETEAEYERFMLGFRILTGFDTKGNFKEKTDALIYKGLVAKDGNIARLTEKGEDLANQVFMEFLGDN